ncbi:MAG: PQQ-binding-like beta-propeller repeat protein [Ferruginibacter sp.]
MKTIPALYILSKGRVAAISKKDGSIIWEVKLKEYVGSGSAYSFGQITAEAGKIYVGTTGILVCLDAKDGSLVWKNDLKGWGYGFVSIAGAGNDSSAAAAAAAASQAASTAAAVAATS